MKFPAVTLSHHSHDIDPRDRISSLPSDLVHRIMECLPLTDAARMSILSNKFRENWRTLPSLTFDANFLRNELGNDRHNYIGYSQLVSKILLQHNGPIAKFSLHIPHYIIKPDVTQWISFVSMNYVQEITLNNNRMSPCLRLPSNLFYCAKLTNLKLCNCRIPKPPSSFESFQCLTSIDLENVFLPNDFGLNTLVVKCPNLERLCCVDDHFSSDLYIDAPNLKYLTISSPFKSLGLKCSLGLLSVSITLKRPPYSPFDKELRKLMEFLTSSKIEKLSFGGFLINFLVVGGVLEKLPMVLTHVRSLSLMSLDSIKELSCTIGIIQSCPNVEVLHVSVTISKDAGTLENTLSSYLTCKFPRLYEITVLVKKVSYPELQFIEFLLACSPVLDIFNLQISEELDENAKLKTLRKLRQFPRASSNLIFFIMNVKGGFHETVNLYSSNDGFGLGPSSDSDGYLDEDEEVEEDEIGEEEEDYGDL